MTRHNAHNRSGQTSLDDLRWPTDRSRDWVRRFLNSAAADPNIMAVIAIGSAIRPNVPSADLDVIVVCGNSGVLDLKPPLEIDLRAYSAADAAAGIGSANDLLGAAVKFGKILFQRDDYWDDTVDLWRDRLPLPSAELARQRAANAHRRLIGVLESGDDDAAHDQAISYMTHLARAELLDRFVYPATRPELPSQLRTVGCHQLADQFDALLQVNHPAQK